MALAAMVVVATTPANAWNGRRAHGWQEGEPDEADRRHPLLGVLANRRLLLLAAALACFNLGNGGMLSLVGQRLVANGADATAWTAAYVTVAQCTVSALQGIGGALSGLFGGMLVGWLGWTAAFLRLAVPGAAAFALALWLAKAAANTETDAAPQLQDSQAR